MKQISHSFHAGGKEHNAKNIKGLYSIWYHNQRKWKDKKGRWNEEEVVNLIGSNNLVKDLHEIYIDLFCDSIEEFNEKQSRDDRKLRTQKDDEILKKAKEEFKQLKKKKPTPQIEERKEELEKMISSISKRPSIMEKQERIKNQNICEEIIIGFGDKKLWENMDYEKEKITLIFQEYIEEFKKCFPNFKIANATLHFDEHTPHAHLVGVPIKENCDRGLKVQYSKRESFNKESLSSGQDFLRVAMVELFNKHMPLENDVWGNFDKKNGHYVNVSSQLYGEMKDTLRKQNERKNNMLNEEHRKNLNKANELASRETELVELIKENENTKQVLGSQLSEIAFVKEIMKKEKHTLELEKEILPIHLKNLVLASTNDFLKDFVDENYEKGIFDENAFAEIDCDPNVWSLHESRYMLFYKLNKSNDNLKEELLEYRETRILPVFNKLSNVCGSVVNIATIMKDKAKDLFNQGPTL